MRKALIFVFAFSLSQVAQGAVNPMELYEVLAVNEAPACGGSGVTPCPSAVATYLKTAGNLECSKTVSMAHRRLPEYACVLRGTIDSGALYEALLLPEESTCSGNVNSQCPSSENTWAKSIKGLICTKTEYVSNRGSKYSCLVEI